MNLEDSVFRARVAFGLPFNKVYPRDSEKFKQFAEQAIVTSAEIEELVSDMPLDVEELARLGTELQVTGANSNFAHGRVLAWMALQATRSSEENPIKVLDIGTARGFSAMALALHLRPHDRVVTLDHLPHDKPFFWGTRSDIVRGRVTREKLLHDIVGDLINRVEFLNEKSASYCSRTDERHQIIFIDGQHDYQAVSLELEWALGCQGPGDFILVDDFETHYPGVDQAVRETLLDSDFYKTRRFSSSKDRSYLLAKRDR